MVERPARSGRLHIQPFLEALLAADRALAEALALRTLDRLGSRLAVFSDLLQPALDEIGELWYLGKIGVADEHRATAVVARVVEQLPPTPADRPVRPGSRFLLAALDGERHLLGLRVVELALIDEGWVVDRLTGPTPLASLVEEVSASVPAVVGISASYLPSAKRLADAVAAIRAGGAAVLVGGAAFSRSPELWKRLGAQGVATDARVGVALARRLLRG